MRTTSVPNNTYPMKTISQKQRATTGGLQEELQSLNKPNDLLATDETKQPLLKKRNNYIKKKQDRRQKRKKLPDLKLLELSKVEISGGAEECDPAEFCT